ncbi:hypothetical protein C8U37_107116 [Trichococcus patagoniensis]|uniref:Uncharacterized protein n=1 Tax=Trichococcus patagoniensis TaxID=382641 RepID=A0A2T5ILP6_9LACT|nr:hypothetical protein [Trichococcus patagoniensis]PTQ84748.1 hypothetical protein C8U37_107116 [Trichococcus patagoniensis]
MTITLPSFLFQLNFWNFVIAVLALFIAIYSVWYTHRRDRYSIEIVECEYMQKKNRPYLIFFSIFNASNAPLKIKDVKLFDLENNPVRVVDYEPKSEYTNIVGHSILDPATIPVAWEYANPFSKTLIIPSESKIEFSYYVNPFPDHMVIKITTDKKIRWFSKKKLFSVKFSELD